MAITQRIHNGFKRDFPLHQGLKFASLLPLGSSVQIDCPGLILILPKAAGLHPISCNRGVREDTMWNRRDWDDFFDIVRKRWHNHRPLRPVDLSRRNRLSPTEGYSLAELDDAGLSIEQAENLGLPVDAGRVGSYGPNVSSLREFIRATRSRF
jgi:hypothetical protein